MDWLTYCRYTCTEYHSNEKNQIHITTIIIISLKAAYKVSYKGITTPKLSMGKLKGKYTSGWESPKSNIIYSLLNS